MSKNLVLMMTVAAIAVSTHSAESIVFNGKPQGLLANRSLEQYTTCQNNQSKDTLIRSVLLEDKTIAPPSGQYREVVPLASVPQPPKKHQRRGNKDRDPEKNCSPSSRDFFESGRKKQQKSTVAVGFIKKRIS